MHRMAVLDWLLVNVERHNDNYMLSPQWLEQEGVTDGWAAAIDHGISFDSGIYARMALVNEKLRGPLLTLTTHYQEGPRQIGVEPKIISDLKGGLARWDQLELNLKQIFADMDHPQADVWRRRLERDIGALRRRVEAMVATGKFLSAWNCKACTGKNYDEL